MLKQWLSLLLPILMSACFFCLPAVAQNEFSKVEFNNLAKFKNYYKSDGVSSYQFTGITHDGYELMWFAIACGYCL